MPILLSRSTLRDAWLQRQADG